MDVARLRLSKERQEISPQFAMKARRRKGHGISLSGRDLMGRRRGEGDVQVARRAFRNVDEGLDGVLLSKLRA